MRGILKGQDTPWQDPIIPSCSPFVKWAGGKTQLIPELESLVPSYFDRYFEPFLGGGAFFFHLISKRKMGFKAYLSDVNNELIDAYKAVKEDVERLIELLGIHENAYRKNPHEYYYKLRAKEASADYVVRAARFITLNKTCYNGLYRVNKDGKFNVPIGRYRKPLICDRENLRKINSALKYSEAQIDACDYASILQDAGENDFIYLDPPYNPTSHTANFTSYTGHGFDDKDQKGLCDMFRHLDKKRCKVLLSNSDTAFVRHLYKDYANFTRKVDALRAINCNGANRAGHKELLIRNYA